MGSPSVGQYITEAAQLTIEERAESLARVIEEAEAFLLGAAMDPAVPSRVKEALRFKADDLRQKLARHSCPTCGSLLLVSEPHCSPEPD